MLGDEITNPPATGSALGWRPLMGYVLMIAAAVAIFLLIRAWGEPSAMPQGASAVVAGRLDAPSKTLFPVLLALVTILITGRGLGTVFQLVGQPRVIGEVVAGILLGPSLLGRLSPEAMQWVFPASVLPSLGVIAQLGVILYMFLVGLELNSERLRSHARATLTISHASIVVPFLWGAGLSLGLFGRFAPAGVTFTSFALFMGVAMSITAFPVLARILTDLRVDRTDWGVRALSCAAAGDVTAWCLLAFVVGVAQAEVGGAFGTLLLAGVFITLMFGVVGPVARRWLGETSATDINSQLVTWVLVALLLSSLAAEFIGIHALFGAFLLGAVIPHDSAVARAFRHKLEDVVLILLLPAFFAHTGLRTQIGLVSGLKEWLVCGVIIVVATLGKFGGTLLAARLTGSDWRTSATLGILMNTRGLMELIVLNIGLDLGVITPTLFAMMVLMALVTTLATTPILRRLQPESR